MSDTSDRGRSPGWQAWQRLRRNRLAMAGGIAVVVMTTLVVAGPWLSPHDPQRQHLWLGALPPGSGHPDVEDENLFAIGARAETAPRAARAGDLLISVRESVAVAYRVALRSGRVSEIVRVAGALPVDRLEAGPGLAVADADGGSAQRPLPAGTLVRDQPPPAGWFAPGSRVLLLRLAAGIAERIDYHVVSDGAAVRAISRAGVAVERAVLRGEHIERVVGDGVELRATHVLGTDLQGRDLAVRILHGGRVSLLIALVATLVSLLIGVTWGAIAGYAGGRTDRLLMAAVDILYSVPFLFLVIVLMVVFGRSLILLFVALGAVQWLTTARIVRGQVLSLKSREFVLAARLAGQSPWAVIRRHLVPNSFGPVVVYATLTVPAVILQESFLSFIGLTVQFRGQALDSWGALVKSGMDALTGDRVWLLLWPSLAMGGTLFALNAVGDGLRDALDPQIKGR